MRRYPPAQSECSPNKQMRPGTKMFMLSPHPRRDRGGRILLRAAARALPLAGQGLLVGVSWGPRCRHSRRRSLDGPLGTLLIQVIAARQPCQDPADAAQPRVPPPRARPRVRSRVSFGAAGRARVRCRGRRPRGARGETPRCAIPGGRPQRGGTPSRGRALRLCPARGRGRTPGGAGTLARVGPRPAGPRRARDPLRAQRGAPVRPPETRAGQFRPGASRDPRLDAPPLLHAPLADPHGPALRLPRFTPAGDGIPLEFLVPPALQGRAFRVLDAAYALAARGWPGLLAYQFVCEAAPEPVAIGAAEGPAR